MAADLAGSFSTSRALAVRPPVAASIYPLLTRALLGWGGALATLHLITGLGSNTGRRGDCQYCHVDTGLEASLVLSLRADRPHRAGLGDLLDHPDLPRRRLLGLHLLGGETPGGSNNSLPDVALRR